MRVGDLEGNARLLRDRIAAARDGGAELVLFPELALTGYPPEDLLLKEHFLQACQEALADVAQEAEGIVALVGYPERAERRLQRPRGAGGRRRARRVPQAAAAQLRRVRRAALLPGGRRGGGDRPRHRADRPHVCEDIWLPGQPRQRGGAGRRDPAGQRLGLALLRRQGRPARGDARPARARQPVRRRLLQPRRRPGRAGLRRPLAGDRPRGRPCWRGRRSSPRRCTLCTRRPTGRGHGAAARHAPAPARAPGAAGGPPRGHARARAARAGRARRRRRAAAGAGGRGVRRAVPRRARLRDQERLHACRAGAVRRDRLHARRARRRRRARPRPRHRAS